MANTLFTLSGLNGLPFDTTGSAPGGFRTRLSLARPRRLVTLNLFTVTQLGSTPWTCLLILCRPMLSAPGRLRFTGFTARRDTR